VGKLTPNKSLKNMGKTSKKNHDYINLTIDGKSYTIDDKGRIDAEFNKDSKISVKGSENGLLAFARVMNNVYRFMKKTPFPKEEKFVGKMVIELKKQKSGEYLAAFKDDKPTIYRTTGGYEKAPDMLEKLEKSHSFKSYELNEKNEGEEKYYELSVAGDTIADAIKACQMLAVGSPWANRHGAFYGILQLKDKLEKEEKDLANSKNKEKRIEFSSLLLAWSIHHILDYNEIMLDESKLYVVDLMPECTEMLKAQPYIKEDKFQMSFREAREYDKDSIEKGIRKILEKLKPTAVSNTKYQIFKPHLNEYYKFFTECLVERVLREMPLTGDRAKEEMKAGTGGSSISNTQGEKKSYKSGSAKD
jgi:hypothetical protein